MKIIALIGPSSCGKTSTLNLVYNDLINNGAIPSNKQPLGGDPNDFSDILTWQGKQIAFFTMGDYARPVVNATRDYNKLNCDCLICACNDRFVTPIYEFQNPIYNYNPIFKAVEKNSSLRSTADQQAAQTIYNLI